MLTQSGVFGGTNLYSYCVNDPVNLTDPTGQSIGVAAAISLFILALSQVILAGLSVYNAFMTMINSFSIGTVFAFILSLLGFAVSAVCLVFAAIGLVSEIRLALSSPVSTQPVQAGAGKGVQGSADDVERIGRWMSQGEYDEMVRTGMVQEPINGSGVSYVARPANPNAFIGRAKPGSLYVEFDVPISSLRNTQAGWAKIIGPNSIDARLMLSKGLVPPISMPQAYNISLVMIK